MNVGEKHYCSKCMRETEEYGVCPHCGYDPDDLTESFCIEEGTLFQNGRYELGAVIGQGGFGITYAAWDMVLDIPVGANARVRSANEAIRIRKQVEYIGDMLGISIDAVVTDGSEPIGNGIGAVLEARDVMKVLHNAEDAPVDLKEKSLFLAGRVLEFDPQLRGGQGYAAAKEILESGKFIDVDEFGKEERDILLAQDLLTTKKIMYAANVSENDAATGNEYTEKLKAYVAENYPNSEVIVISAKIEAEIAQLDDEEKAMFLEELGLETSGIQRVIKCGYELLNLIVYFTAGKKECKAWQIEKGTKAPQAAGKIHSDFERGFIRAEVTKYEKLLEAGSEVKAKELAYTRIEGKDYVIEDGDVVYFRFNV